MAEPQDAMLGTGLARKAVNTIVNKKAYDRYVIETSTEGNEPMSMADWIASQNQASAEEDAAYRAEMKG